MPKSKYSKLAKGYLFTPAPTTLITIPSDTVTMSYDNIYQNWVANGTASPAITSSSPSSMMISSDASGGVFLWITPDKSNTLTIDFGKNYTLARFQCSYDNLCYYTRMSSVSIALLINIYDADGNNTYTQNTPLIFAGPIISETLNIAFNNPVVGQKITMQILPSSSSTFPPTLPSPCRLEMYDFEFYAYS